MDIHFIAMGRHDHDDYDRKVHKHETKDERLLRKAKEYVQREEQKKDRDKTEERKRSNGRKREESRAQTHRKREHKEERKRSRRDYDSDSDHHRSHRKKHHKKDTKREKKEQSQNTKKFKIDKSKLYPLGDILGTPPSKLLSIDADYFAFHQYLWLYLYREEGKMFGDLTSEEARAAFQRFCDKYNAGKLEQTYYKEGALPQQAMDECKTTRHKWGFQTSETERKSLQLVEEGVRKQTEYDADNKGDFILAASARLPTRLNEEDNVRNSKTAEKRLEERRMNHRLRDHVRTAEDELIGGSKDGRERQIELKQVRAAAIHASARDKEANMGGAELDDSVLYGGDASDFQQALSRERQKKAQRHEKTNERIKDLQQKEDDRQKAMLMSLGLSNIQPGQKITIQPR